MGKLLTKGKDKKIFGVCSGIAEYTDIDVSVVRIVTAITALCWGIGIIVYLVAAIILPEPTPEN